MRVFNDLSKLSEKSFEYMPPEGLAFPLDVKANTWVVFGLPELLHLARESLVEAVAANISSDVHTRITVINLAHDAGFGVRARNQQGTFSSVIKRDAILKKLTDLFKLKFTPFTIPELIRQQLLSCISSYYRGAIRKWSKL